MLTHLTELGAACSCDHCRLVRIEHKLDLILHGDDAALLALAKQLRDARTPLAAAVATASSSS